MVCFENEAAVDQIYMRRNLLEDHPYMHNVSITRDLPRSERRNQRVSNMLNEASQSGRSAHIVIPEATVPISNDRPTTPSTDTTSGGNTEGQNRATTDSTEIITEGEISFRGGDNVNTSTTSDNVSPSDTVRNEGEPIIQQSDNTNGEGENLVSSGQTIVNAEGGIVNESNSSGNEGEGGPEGGS